MAQGNPARNIFLFNWSCSQAPHFGEGQHQLPIWHILSLGSVLTLPFSKPDQGACLSTFFFLFLFLFLRRSLARLPRLALSFRPLHACWGYKPAHPKVHLSECQPKHVFPVWMPLTPWSSNYDPFLQPLIKTFFFQTRLHSPSLLSLALLGSFLCLQLFLLFWSEWFRS